MERLLKMLKGKPRPVEFREIAIFSIENGYAVYVLGPWLVRTRHEETLEGVFCFLIRLLFEKEE